MAEIKIFHNKECGAWQEVLPIVEHCLTELQLPVEYQIILVQTKEEAREYKFLGSPTIKIDGHDVESDAENRKDYSLHACRNYSFNDEVFPYPPKEMVLETLKQLF